MASAEVKIRVADLPEVKDALERAADRIRQLTAALRELAAAQAAFRGVLGEPDGWTPHIGRLDAAVAAAEELTGD